MDIEEMKSYLVDEGYATEQEIELVSDINGYNEKTMEDILYARTGYNDFEEIMEDF